MVKLKDLAEKSGFSITTVSRALAGYKDVNEHTRQQIIEIALEMGYQPNMVARQLRARKTHTVGIIAPSASGRFADDYFSELLMSVGHAAAQRGYDLLVTAKTTADEMDAYRRIVGGNRVDGMVIARTRRRDARIAYLRAARHPFVVSGRAAPDEESDFPYIDADSQLGIRWILNHLTGLGHQRIALLLPPDRVAFTPYRLAGYRQGLEDAGLSYREAYVLNSDLSRSGGQQAAHHLLDNYPEITAIVACNDPMAIGAMNAIQTRNMRVGQDIAVTGFDDITAADFAHPRLTTVRQPIKEIGQRLLEMLIQIIHQIPLEQPQVLLSPELVIRESCGAGQQRKEAVSPVRE